MTRGRLRIYLGAAPGVGKTFAMLNEGWRRHERGTDVVVGVVETHGRARTLEQLRDLEVIPRRSVEYRGSTLTEMDVDAILARRPELCLVDELAHTNAAGSRHEKRWQDVQFILAAGIDVISTVNVQHLESLNDVVERITGVTQRETVPDEVVRAADQIELVDMSPEALRRRMAHGNIYPPERIDAAMSHYFRPGNLGALRELALLWVADRVEESLQDYLEQHGIEDAWETRERVIVAVSAARSADDLIRRGARIARRARGELVAVHIAASDGRVVAGADPQAAGVQVELEARRRLVTDLGGSYREIVADDPASALVAFARAEHATQLVLGTSRRRGWADRIRGSFVQRVIGQAGGIDVHVVAPRGDDGAIAATSLARAPRARLFTSRRVAAAWSVTAVGLPGVTAVLVAVRDSVSLPTVLLAYLLLVLGVAAIGGRRVSFVAALAAAVAENFYFVRPLHTLTIQRAEDAVAIVMFLVVGVTVGTLVERAARQTADATRARAEAESLARTTATLATASDPLPGLLEHLRDTFGLTGAAVLCQSDGGGWEQVAAAGDAPGAPDAGSLPLHTSDETPEHVLALRGRRLSADDLRVMSVLTGQVGIAIEARRLHDDAETLESLEQVDATRTALLRAVSHDLRSPLASIKAYVSGLLADDVRWSSEQIHDALSEINLEVDRLDRLVGNLLDAGRLESGMGVVQLRATELDDVVSAACAVIDAPLDVNLPPDLPAVAADAALLERSIENLVMNAVRHGSSDVPVRVDAAVVGGRVLLRVVDRGNGIPSEDRTRVLAPFHRLGDRNATEGVGLGLAITQGFVTAMGGTLELDDTPGGGLTVTLSLRVAEPVSPGTAAAALGSTP